MAVSMGLLDTFYVIIGSDKCRNEKHLVLSMDIDVELEHSPTLRLPGQYCYSCNQAQVPRRVWAEHAAVHNEVLSEVFLKGFDDVVFVEEKPDYSDYVHPERADESKLKKYGYSVSENSRYTTAERQDLLRRIIASKEVSKGYVVSCLRHLILINGKKESNHIALKKWESDLEYVLKL